MRRFLTGTVIASMALLTMVFATGCWNRRELDTLAIVSGIGLDMEKAQGRDVIKITAQIVKPGEVRASTGETNGASSSPVLIMESTGDTVFDAVRNFTLKSSRKIFFPHNQVIIIGEEAARAGVQPLLDFFVRDHESRGRVLILVARGKAGDILRARAGQEEIPAMGIADLEEASFATSKTTPMRLHEFINCLLSKTTAPAVSSIESYKDDENKTLAKLTGSAFFKNGKLAGYLDGTECRGLLWVLGKVKSGIIAVDCPGMEQKVSLEIIRSSRQVKVDIRNGKPFIRVAIKEEGNLGDDMCLQDFAAPGKLDLVEKRQGEAIKREVEAALKKARQYKADIFGFGEEVYRSHPAEWKNMEQNWEEIFPETEVEITVEAKLRRVGMTVKPLKAE